MLSLSLSFGEKKAGSKGLTSVSSGRDHTHVVLPKKPNVKELVPVHTLILTV